MKRSRLVRKSPLKARVGLTSKSELRSKTEIRQVSSKRARQMREYGKLRGPFLAARPWCESPWDCGQRATEVQHRRGRQGARLLDMTWWAASCSPCNQRAETDTGEALRLGWLVPIEGAA